MQSAWQICVCLQGARPHVRQFVFEFVNCWRTYMRLGSAKIVKLPSSILLEQPKTSLNGST